MFTEESSDDDDDLDDTDQDDPIHEQFLNANFAQTRDSVCELTHEPTCKASPGAGMTVKAINTRESFVISCSHLQSFIIFSQVRL